MVAVLLGKNDHRNPAAERPGNLPPRDRALAHETCTNLRMVRKAKILVVEDNSDVRRLYAIGLNQRGFEVKLAANGAEAVERIHAEKPDVVLLDWLMPLMDGSEVLSKLGENGSRSVAVIVISGQPAPEKLDPRIHSWLEKPVTIDELVTEVEGATGPG
jgi:CheY-like chemotaxis protein